MKRYNELEKEVGIKPEHIEPISAYYAYKNGEVKEFSSKKEALDYSANIERFTKNEEERRTRYAEIIDFDTKVYKLWFDSLRKEYSYLNDDIFQICYNEAYDRGHHSGHDEVANYMIDVVAFFDRISNALAA